MQNVSREGKDPSIKALCALNSMGIIRLSFIMHSPSNKSVKAFSFHYIIIIIHFSVYYVFPFCLHSHLITLLQMKRDCVMCSPKQVALQLHKKHPGFSLAVSTAMFFSLTCSWRPRCPLPSISGANKSMGRKRERQRRNYRVIPS